MQCNAYMHTYIHTYHNSYMCGYFQSNRRAFAFQFASFHVYPGSCVVYGFAQELLDFSNYKKKATWQRHRAIHFAKLVWVSDRT